MVARSSIFNREVQRPWAGLLLLPLNVILADMLDPSSLSSQFIGLLGLGAFALLPAVATLALGDTRKSAAIRMTKVQDVDHDRRSERSLRGQ